MATGTRPMRFSVGLFPYDRWGGVAPIAEAARAADEAGLFGLTLPEHIVMPVRPDVPPVSAVWYDNFVLAAHLATLTRRIRFIFSVMVVPYRPPVQTAKLISTLDVISGGRLIVGVGAGWLRGEFRTLGLPIEERGEMTDEYLRAMKALWTQDRPEFEGKYVRFSRIAFEPKCVQQPHVPLWIGGTGKRPFRRVVELGDGWIPMTGDLPQLRQQVAALKEQARAAGRDPEKLDFSYSVVVGERDPDSDRARSHASGQRDVIAEHTHLPTQAESPQAAQELIHAYQEAGFTHLSVGFAWRTLKEYREKLEWFAAKVMPAFTR